MRNSRNFGLRLGTVILVMCSCLMAIAQQKRPSGADADKQTNLIAQNMLICQRSSGGWSKHLEGEKLKSVQLNGYKYENILDASTERGFDRRIVKDPGSVIWARFYEVETNESFISGRDGLRKET